MPAVFDEDKNQMAEGAAVVPLVDNSGGTASNTLAAITGSYVEATIENTVASLAAKVNEIITALAAQGDFAAD